MRRNGHSHAKGETKMPALIAGGAVIGGSLLEGMFSRRSSKKSISFQREMAQKAHQYEVADLRAAGLNPILSGTGGGGARASGGAMPATPNFSGAASSALALKAQIENTKAQTQKTTEEAAGVKLQNVTRVLEAYIAGGKLTVLKEGLKTLGLTPDEIADKLRDLSTGSPIGSPSYKDNPLLHTLDPANRKSAYARHRRKRRFKRGTGATKKHRKPAITYPYDAYAVSP